MLNYHNNSVQRDESVGALHNAHPKHWAITGDCEAALSCSLHNQIINQVSVW